MIVWSKIYEKHNDEKEYCDMSVIFFDNFPQKRHLQIKLEYVAMNIIIKWL